MAVSLTYFDGRGLGEIPRLLLHEAGVKFEDRRLKDIAPLKPELPFGQVPLYQEGDFKLAQSQAIARYIARTHNLYGKDAHESALIDSFIDGLNDARTHERNAKDVSPGSVDKLKWIYTEHTYLGCCQGHFCQGDSAQVARLLRELPQTQ